MNLYSNIWSILNSEFRKKVLFLVFLMFVGVILETLSIGIIIPLISLLLDTKTNPSYIFLENLFQNLNIGDGNSILFYAIGLFFLCFLIKILFLIYISYFQNKITYKLQAYLAHALFFSYLKQNYDFHLRNNSSRLIRNISSEVNLFCAYVLLATAILTLECLVSLALVIFLIIFEPLGAFFVVTLFILFCLIFLIFLKKRLHDLGINRQNLAKYNLQNLMQGFEGIKEIKFLNIEEKFANYFKNTIFKTSKVNYFYSTIMTLPRFSLELLTIISICILIVVLKLQALPDSAIISTVAVFGAASFRILPSAARIMGAIQNIKYGSPTLEILKNELKLDTKVVDQKISDNKEIIDFNNKINIDKVYFHYDKETKILNNINLEINKKDKIGIIGSTGSGKSTLIDLITGLLKVTSGEIKVDGKSVYKNLAMWQKKIGYVSQSIFLLDDTLLNNIIFGLNEKADQTVINEVLKISKLDELVNNLSEGINTFVGERGSRISGGQKQRLGIARALYRKPEILVLDEATSALDNSTEKSIMDEIHESYKNQTLIIVSHRESALSKCNKIYEIKNGLLSKKEK